MAIEQGSDPQRGLETQVRIARGGVSPIPHGPAVHGLEVLAKPPGVVPAAAAFPRFVFNGGPVITTPLVYTSFWGSLWLGDPAHLERAGRLSQFLQDLMKSNFMNVLSQYGVGTGAGSGCFIRASFLDNVPATLTDSEIHSIIQSCIDAGVLPEPTQNTALVIYLDENIGVDDLGQRLILCEPQNDDAFGYHNFFVTTAGNPFYYAIIPGLSDTCLTESCPSDNFCSLHLSETQEQRLTQVTSHEFAEMVTDPQLNAWFDPDPGIGENGDICNGESDTIAVGANTWTVQRTYSKLDDLNSNGAVFCLSQAPNPEPRLSPGPQARPADLARPQQVASLERLLPLPPIRFDINTKKATMDEQELYLYTRKLFYPLRHEHIMSDLTGFLRQAADLLAKK
jgi:hypothetical protein